MASALTLPPPIHHQPMARTIQEAPILHLPDELFFRMLSFLAGKDILKCELICWQWNQSLDNENPFWKGLLDDHFPHRHLENNEIPKETFKSIYSNIAKGIYESHAVASEKIGVLSLAIGNGNLFSGSHENKIHVWNPLTNPPSCIHELTGHTNSIKSLIVAGDKLFSGSVDKTIKIWDLKQDPPICIQTLKEHKNSVNCIAIVEDKLISGSHDCKIKIWDLKQELPTCINTLEGHKNSVNCFAIAEDKLFSGSHDCKIKVWDLNSGANVRTLKGHQSPILSLVYSDGKLFSGSDDGHIKVWDIKSGTCTKTLVNEHRHGVTALVAAEEKLFSGSQDNRIILWDLNSGAYIATLDRHTEWINTLAFAQGRLYLGSWWGSAPIKVLDFTANQNKIFEQIASLYERHRKDAFAFSQSFLAKERFSMMPKTERHKIYEELCKILKPNLANISLEFAENAFDSMSSPQVTSLQRALAIRNYLNDKNKLNN